MAQPREIEASPTEAVQLAATLLRAGREAEAESILLRVLEEVPENADALHFLGMVRYRQGENDAAVELLRRAVERAPDYLDARNNLGNLLRLMGRRDEAEQEYRRIVDADANHGDAWVNLGSLHQRRGELEQSLECYQRALAVDPDDFRAWLNQASALRRAGRLAEADAAFRRVLDLHPENIEAYLSLGRLLYRTRRYAEAARVYRRWLELAPDHPVARHMVAACGLGVPPTRASNEFVRSTFDAFADGFDETLEVLQYSAPRLVAEALAAARPQPAEPLHILDAGCGTGLCGPLVKPLAGYLAGVDLSPAMVARARERRMEPPAHPSEPVYDHLAVAELTSWMAAHPQQFDAVVAADVLVYFGTLDGVFRAAATALRPGGILVFTTEHHDEEGATAAFKLHPHGRYSHSERYVRDELHAAGLALERSSAVELRMELGEAVAGTLTVARKLL